MDLRTTLAQDATTNAALSWFLIATMLLMALVLLLEGSLLEGGLALVAIGILVRPAAFRYNWQVMLPWPLGFAVAVGFFVRLFGIVPEINGYVVISALSLAIIVQLDAFTDVEMSRRFSVLFALMTTIAVQTWWSIAQYYSDLWLGTDFIRSQTELQWDLVAVTVVSLLMSALFLWYFDRIEHVGSRRRPLIPEETS